MDHACIVESMGACETARKAGIGNGIQWLTTSPYLLEKLTAEVDRIRSLEEGVGRNEIDALAKAGYDFTFALCDLMNQSFSWRGSVDFRTALAFGVNNCFFPLFYKALLLQAALNEYPGRSLVCVGNAGTTRGSGLRLLWGRFDNLFALLASRSSLDSMSVLPHQDDQEALECRERAVLFRRLGAWEKGLSLLNNTPGSFLAKTYGLLHRRGLYPFRHLALWPRPGGRHVYIYNDCEHIDEILPGLLWRGVRVGRLDRLPACVDVVGEAPEKVDGVSRQQIGELCERSLVSRGLPVSPLFQTAAAVVAERILAAVRNLKEGLSSLRQDFDLVLAKTHHRGIILSNALAGPEERIFYCHCREQGRRVVAFEHGLTYGLSEWDSWCARHAGMLAADMGLYHTETAAACIRPYAPAQTQLAIGLPRIICRPPLPALQRRLARKWLGLGRDEHVIFYLAGIERNNYIYGPGAENDFQQHRRIYDAVRALRRDFSGSRIVVKLYPSTRYAEQHQYEDLAALEGVLVVRNMDFRFLRCAADVIFLPSAQSTLGWCLGARAAVMHLESEQAPVRFDGFSMGYQGIPGLRTVRMVAMPQFASCANYDGDFFRKLLA